MNRLLLLALLLVLAAPLLAGCSTRRVLVIDSRPSDARLWVNGNLLKKRTPVEVPFTHYCWFEVRLEKEGYESVGTELRVPSQIDGFPVIDFVLELFIRERRFRRVIDMRALRADPSETDVQAVMRRAETFRERTLREVREAKPPERIAP